VQSAPYVTRKKNGDGFEGYCIDLAEKILKDELKVNYTLRIVADNKYGAKTNDGKWNGMIGELTERVCILKSTV
jgi:hypothetical protein